MTSAIKSYKNLSSLVSKSLITLTMSDVPPLVIFLKPNQKYEPLTVVNFCTCGISFDELPEFQSDVMHIGLFITRKQKRKNWNVIHRTFPFLQKQLKLEQSIGMYILRLNIDGQLVNHSHSAALTESQTLSSVIYSKKLYFVFSK